MSFIYYKVIRDSCHDHGVSGLISMLAQPDVPEPTIHKVARIGLTMVKEEEVHPLPSDIELCEREIQVLEEITSLRDDLSDSALNNIKELYKQLLFAGYPL